MKRDTGGGGFLFVLIFFFVSPSGTDGTTAKTWIVAQDSAMCPTDGPSKYEGTSCTDGQFCLSGALLKTEIQLMHFLKQRKQKCLIRYWYTHY